MVIQHNLAAMNANRQFKINTDKTRKIAEKLSSGYKINRSADDAAGLAMSEKMRRQIRGLGQAAENIQEGIGYVQTAEGALNEVHDMLQRMNELAVKSANGTNTDEDREYIDAEVQQLKSELDRVFSTTTFNEIRIWEPDPDARVQIDVEKKQAVTFSGSNSYPDITNDNCGIIAYNGYTLNADDQGIHVSWKGFDGNTYETTKIDWATLEANNYSFEMSDYYDATTYPNLFDSNGKPVLKYKIAYSIQETTTIDDMIECINGRTIGSNESVSMSGRFEDKNGNSASNYMSVTETSANYSAAYVSHVKSADGRDFDAADDVYLAAADSSGNRLTSSSTKGNVISSPSATTVANARNSTEGWELSFDMKGIGKVTAKSSYISYWAPSDTSADDEDDWWYWAPDHYDSSGKLVYEKRAKERNVGTGTLGDVMSVLTGEKGSTTPGLLKKVAGSPDTSGDADNGGYIQIHFNLTADNAYSSGSVNNGTSVGSFALEFKVSNTDTEDSVLQKIRNALNDTAIVDFYSSSKYSDDAYLYRPTAKSKLIDVPIWGGMCKFHVQAGTEAGQRIEIQYEALSNIFLELEDVDVLDVAGCDDAINRIKSAMIEVSKQRSDFGAYQNRLEKSYNVNKNTQENTQYSESRIRDTDMAKTMVEYSNHNVLLQAGQAILSQMNNYNQGVLQLLQ